MKKRLICIILAALLLSACSCGAPAPSESGAPAPSESGAPAPSESGAPAPSESAAPAPSESESQLSFPEAGHILDVDCSGNVLPEDDGTRSVRLRWVTSESEELSHDFPLSGTPSGEAAPVLRLRQEWSTGALVFWDSTPVSDTEDRAYILGLLENSAFSSTEEGLPNLILTVTDGETTTEYPVFAKDAAEDFFRLSALAYKYAAPQTLTAGDRDWNAGFDTDYRLCLRSGELHADLDRAQALVLLRALFGEVGQSAAFPDYTGAPLSPELPEESVCLTEYWLEPYDDTPKIHEQHYYLLPNGTLARLTGTVNYLWSYGSSGIEIESLTPSWPRVAVAEGAFDWELLRSALHQLT